MRKFLLSLSLALLSVGAMCQMTAREIVDRYNKLTGFDQIENADGALFLDMKVKTEMGYIDMKLIKGSKAKVRAEMTIMGQDVILASNGTKGWIKVAGQPAEPMPQESMEALTSQGDVTTSLKIDTDQFDYTLTDDQGDLYVVKGTPVKSKKNMIIKDMTMSFDKESGMMVSSSTKMLQNGKEVEMNTEMSDVKSFGEFWMASYFILRGDGLVTSSVVVRDMKINYPTSASMFEKPE